MQQFNMIINGQSVQSAATFDVINPATGEAFAQCQEGTAANVDEAVAAARAAFPAWSQTSSDERKAKMHELAAAIEANMPELMQLVTQQNGKSTAGLNMSGAGMEVWGSAAWTHY